MISLNGNFSTSDMDFGLNLTEERGFLESQHRESKQTSTLT
jgi:hypothetical protein